jgi:hypothetical protein
MLAPTRHRTALLAKDREARRERKELAAAAASDAPSTAALVEATLGLGAQIGKLNSIEERLERMAAAAEASQSTQGVAVLSGQQLRGIETGAKLAGVGGIAPRSAEAAVPGERFSVTILLGDQRETTIATVVEPHPLVIEQEPIDQQDDGDA